jgi:perosamine synthetase
MAARLRLVAPAGAPLPAGRVLDALRASTPADRVREALTARFGVRHAFLLSSGRAALTVLLEALRARSTRHEVVIPAYTCFSVPSAIARAGLTIRLCDVDPKTLDMDMNALVQAPLDRALAIVPSGLYGMPGDLEALEALAGSVGAQLVDDAAQCLGATVHGKACGTFGQAGFCSLGRGKGLTTLGGGLLITDRDDIADTLEAAVGSLPRPRGLEVLATVIGALAYSIMLAPSRYWIVDRLPFLELGASRFEPGFPIARLSAYQGRLVHDMLPLVESYNTTRRARAEALRAGIDGIEGVEVPRPLPGARPVYLRLPLLARDTPHRSRLLMRLRAAGIGASASYPTPIGDIPGISRYLAPDQAACPGAATVAARILTLPTHPGVTSEDVERAIGIVRGTR